MNQRTRPRSKTPTPKTQAQRPTKGSPPQPRVKASMRCTYCHDDLPRGGRRFCAGCMAPHHEECWLEHGMCSAGGCGEVEWVETTKPREKRRRRQGARERRGPLRARIESEGTTALVLGLVALVACGLAGPFAISKANEVTRMARRARVPVPGSATGGLVMGWIGTAGVVLSLFVVVLQFGLLVSS